MLEKEVLKIVSTNWLVVPELPRACEILKRKVADKNIFKLESKGQQTLPSSALL